MTEMRIRGVDELHEGERKKIVGSLPTISSPHKREDSSPVSRGVWTETWSDDAKIGQEKRRGRMHSRGKASCRGRHFHWTSL